MGIIRETEKPKIEAFNRVHQDWRLTVPKSVRDQFVDDEINIKDIGDGLSELVDRDSGEFKVKFNKDGKILIPKELRDKYDYRKKGFAGFLNRKKDEGVLMFPISKLEVPGLEGEIRLLGNGKFKIEKED